MRGQFAGYTDSEWRDYAEGRYAFTAPPVSTANWDAFSWMAWIFGPVNPCPRCGGDGASGAPGLCRDCYEGGGE